jgi:hypothetical protein
MAEEFCGCGERHIDNERVREARALMAAVDHYGNLHCNIDDGNLEDFWFQDDGGEGHRSVRQDVMANHAEASPAELVVEMQLVSLLEAMPFEERCAAYGLCAACMEQR